MKNARQLLWGIIIALISIIFILVGVSLSLAEGKTNLPKTSVPQTTTTPTSRLFTPLSFSPTSPDPALSQTPIQDSPTPMILAQTSAQPQDTSTPDLASPTSGKQPTRTKAAASATASCGAPSGWVRYTVVKGDTLFRLGQAYGVTVPEIQKANCMGDQALLKVGQKLYLPPGPTRRPPATQAPPANTATSLPTVPTSLP